MKHQNFIDRDKLYSMLDNNEPTEEKLNEILNRARKLKGLKLEDVAKLLCVEDEAGIAKILDTAHYCSFVGLHPVPIVYGMTIGEYARMINGEHWLQGGVECDLWVAKMKGYRRDSVGYELPVPPSPNLRNFHAIALYPSLCLFEGTHCGVGRGTDYPFEWVTYGSDTLDLRYEQAPVAFSLKYLMLMYNQAIKQSNNQTFFLKNNFFEKLAGNGDLRKQIESGMSEEEIRATWQPALDEFKKIRAKYLIYGE